MEQSRTIETIISDHSLFRELRTRYIHLIAKGAQEASFEADEVIFHEGDFADRFYLIRTGRVAVESATSGSAPICIQVVRAGDVVGWSWLFPPYKWHFQARALEPTTAIVVDGTHLLIACEDHADLGYLLMKRISQVLIQRLHSTRQQLVRAADLSRRGVRLSESGQKVNDTIQS